MNTPLSQALGLMKGDAVAITGGGGKTSLLYTLASENPFGRILCTTSTKMFDPRRADHPFDRILIPWKESRLPDPESEKESCFCAAGLVPEQSEKVTGLSGRHFHNWRDQKNWPLLIIEADGAAGKPLKAAAEHEPVIPACVTVFIACIGLDILGKSLNKQWVHRPELVSERTGLKMGQPIETTDLKRLLFHKEGVFKGCKPGVRKILLLNKADVLTPGWKINDIVDNLKSSGTEILVSSLVVPPFIRLHC